MRAFSFFTFISYSAREKEGATKREEIIQSPTGEDLVGLDSVDTTDGSPTKSHITSTV